MIEPSFSSRRFSFAKPLVTVVVCLPLLLAAQQTTVSLAGPSMVNLSSSAVFQGSGLAPNSAVSVAITAPNGAESHFSAVADASGQLSYRVAPGSTGKYALKLLDSGGRLLSSTNFYVTQ